ncbi:MAG: hypothetical protein HC880_09430, partial [Bacteroidia bacterium]|nr:hypothetical protein [Bacteroidia bacterium]
MKLNHYSSLICTLVVILLALWPSGSLAAPTDSLLLENHIREHQQQYQCLQAQNAHNEALGQSQHNDYLFGDLEYLTVLGQADLERGHHFSAAQIEALRAQLLALNEEQIARERQDARPRPRVYVHLTGFLLGLYDPVGIKTLSIQSYEAQLAALSPEEIYQKLNEGYQRQTYIDTTQYADYAARISHRVQEVSQKNHLLISYAAFLKLIDSPQPQVRRAQFFGFAVGKAVHEQYQTESLGSSVAQALNRHKQPSAKIAACVEEAAQALKENNRRREALSAADPAKVAQVMALLQAQGQLAIDKTLEQLVGLFTLLKIPEPYWNAQHRDYPFSSLSPDDQVALALMAGCYNQLLDEIKGTPELIQLYVLFVRDEAFRSQILQAVTNPDWGPMWERLQEQTGKHFASLAQLDTRAAYLLGQDVVVVASVAVGLHQLKA